ncbi:uncharacterized protein LOC122659286 [Telopea speciosissima]|uniref:uncharacterized protein LOC122659286 n=1 Tax=Telopea speciosissima TaxID=54955 RepID=UPI001CC6720B|nr:uncharacterized protein LOC122659286 [Telopea speciosissima]
MVARLKELSASLSERVAQLERDEALAAAQPTPSAEVLVPQSPTDDVVDQGGDNVEGLEESKSKEEEDDEDENGPEEEGDGEQRDMWERLELFSQTSLLPWAIGGDFNAVLSPTKKVGGRPECSLSLEEFRSSVNNAALIDARYIGNVFTQTNKQEGACKFMAQLDHFLLNNAWLTAIHSSQSLHHGLCTWNKEVLGNIHQNVKNAEDAVSRAEASYHQLPNPLLKEELNVAKENLQKVLLQEEIFWRQKSKATWLKEGERNTKFFHDMVNVRRKKADINKLKMREGMWIDDPEEVKTEAVRHFSNIVPS